MLFVSLMYRHNWLEKMSVYMSVSLPACMAQAHPPAESNWHIRVQDLPHHAQKLFKFQVLKHVVLTLAVAQPQPLQLSNQANKSGTFAVLCNA